MQCLSVQQPWANLIAMRRKCLEIRSWSTSYRGRLLIHTGKTIRGKWEKESLDVWSVSTEPRGCIVAICDLVDVRRFTEADEIDALCSWEPDHWAWELSAIEPIEPFPLSGQRGLFEVEVGAWLKPIPDERYKELMFPTVEVPPAGNDPWTQETPK